MYFNENWSAEICPLNRGNPLNRGPLNRGFTVHTGKRKKPSSRLVQSNPDLATIKIATNLNLPTKKSRMTNFLLIKNRQNSNIPNLATYFWMTANVAKSWFDCTKYFYCFELVFIKKKSYWGNPT